MLRILDRACGIVSFARTQEIPRLNFSLLWDTLASPFFSGITVLSFSLTLILFLHKLGSKNYHYSIKYKGKEGKARVWMGRLGGRELWCNHCCVGFLVPRPQPPMPCRVYPSVHKVPYPYTTSIIASAQLLFSLDNRGLVHPVVPLSSRGSRGGEGGWGK